MSAYSIVAEFERRVAEFAGSRYGVAVDCCTSAIFLSLKYLDAAGKVMVPAKTYISVPFAVMDAGCEPEFVDSTWLGAYTLWPYEVTDGAKRFRRGMYQGGLHCLSFHLKKHLPIGRGGMILTDDEKAAAWLRRARYDGREGKPYAKESVTMRGWHVYMQPHQASRGLELMDVLPSDNLPDLAEDYPDLREMPVFQKSLKVAA